MPLGIADVFGFYTVISSFVHQWISSNMNDHALICKSSLLALQHQRIINVQPNQIVRMSYPAKHLIKSHFQRRLSCPFTWAVSFTLNICPFLHTINCVFACTSLQKKNKKNKAFLSFFSPIDPRSCDPCTQKNECTHRFNAQTNYLFNAMCKKVYLTFMETVAN